MQPISAPSSSDQVSTLVFKKQLDQQKDQVQQILQSAQPVAPGPAHLGQNVDLFA